jgi:hypothetical protein
MVRHDAKPPGRQIGRQPFARHVAEPSVHDKVKVARGRTQPKATRQRPAVETQTDRSVPFAEAKLNVPGAMGIGTIEVEVGYIGEPDGEDRVNGIGPEPFQSGLPIVGPERPAYKDFTS